MGTDQARLLSPSLMEPVHVLVKVHADGYIEVFGPRHVRARVVYVPACQSQLQERIMEAQIDAKLPRQYHFAGGEVRSTGYMGGYGDTYEEYLEKAMLLSLDMEILQCLKSMGKAENSFTPPPTGAQPSGHSTTGPTSNTSEKP